VILQVVDLCVEYQSISQATPRCVLKTMSNRWTFRLDQCLQFKKIKVQFAALLIAILPRIIA